MPIHPVYMKNKRLRSDQMPRELPDKITLRGRVFARDDLETIRRINGRLYTEGRTRISEIVCIELDWRQPNGWLKDRACRDVLRSLDDLGFIELPESKNKGFKVRYSDWRHRHVDAKTELPLIQVIEGDLRLVLAKGDTTEALWNNLVQKYHYLGHKVTVGKALKFLVYSGSTILSAISLSEPAWAVDERDKALEIIGCDRSKVANNSRFLILPNVRVKNLASRILSLVATDGAEIWTDYYSCELECLETFVDSSRFKGVSYKAANWTNVGVTKGYRKSGKAHFNSQTRKYIFIYPLSHSKRMLLAAALHGKTAS